MMTDRKPNESRRLLDIILDSPPNYVFTSGEILPGRVTLRSSADEDVYSIILQLTGIGKSYVGLAGRNDQSIGLPDQWAGQVFLDLHQQLYQGTYKLRKDVTYEWPFKMRFPEDESLIPSGTHGKNQMMSNGDTAINYELKVFRATSAEQTKALLEKAAKGQDAGTVSKLRGLTASTASMSLNFLPSRPNYIPSELTPVREVWDLPIRGDDDQQASGGQPKGFNFKSIFKPSPSMAYTVRVDLPKNFAQFEQLPAFIRIIPKFEEPGNPGPITVEKVEYVLSMRVRHKASGYVGENLLQVTILKLDHPGIVIHDSGRYYIGGKYSSNTPMWPTFNSDVVETRHNLRAHVTLNASGKKFNDIFPLIGCKVYPNRVMLSPLNKDYVCNFFSRSAPLPDTENDHTDGSTVQHKDILDGFFAISRLFTAANINPQIIDSRDASSILSFLLPGQGHLQTKPNSPIPETTILPGTLSIPDPLVEDHRRISQILESGSSFQATTNQLSTDGSFAYRYGGEKSSSQIRIEFSDPSNTSTFQSPPSYTEDPTSKSSTPPLSPTHGPLTLPKILNLLLHALSTSTPSSTTDPTLSNITYLCQEYHQQFIHLPSSTTSVTSPSISIPAAQAAVAKYPQLRKPLVELAGLDAKIFGEEEDDEPKPKVLTKEEAKLERQKELANKVGAWSTTAAKREVVYQSN